MAIGLTVGLWFVIAYVGANWLAGSRGILFDTTTRLDAAVPFLPGMAAIYLSLFPALWLPVILMKRRSVFMAQARALSLAILLAAAIFVAFPVLAPALDATVPYALFRLADQVNLEYCGLPSLHVTFALWIFLVSVPLVSRPAALVLALWASLAIISTVTTRQHTVADAIAGAVLALLNQQIFYPFFLNAQKARR